nr:unnamed protein product [Digitaria exilis]
MWAGVCGAQSLPEELVSTHAGGRHRSSHGLRSRAMASAGIPEGMMTGQGGAGAEGHGGAAVHDDNQYYYYLKSRKVGERWPWMVWVLCCLVFSVWIFSSMSSQAVEMRRDELTSMCEERARMLEDKVKVSMNHLQALAMVFSTLDPSKYPSGKEHITFAIKMAQRTAFEGLAYAGRLSHHDKHELFEGKKKEWSIMTTRHAKMMNSSKPEECACGPITFAEDALMYAISLNNLSGTTEDRENVLRARQSAGKVVLTAPFKLLNHGGIGVLLTYAAYKPELRPNATEQERRQSTVGYMGGIFDIEALADELLQKLAGKQSIMVNVYDSTNRSLLSMYGSNDHTEASGMCHISILNFGDPSRKHEMHCRFKQRPPWPWMAIASSIATIVVSLHVGYTVFHITGNKQIAQVKYGCKESDMKMPLKDGNESIGHDGELMGAGVIPAIDKRLLNKKEETTTVIQNGTVMHYLLPAPKARITTVRLGLWIASLSVIVLVLGTAVCLLLWCKCNRQKRLQQKELELLGGMGPRGFELHELESATSNFADDNKLGRGGFGPVYRGYLKDLDLDVAIKVLSEKQSSQEESEQGLREFKAEVKVMTQLRHRNIVKLVGWCDSNKRLLLVYELMTQGSLDKHLYNQERILTWQQRFRIVLDLGSGLLYLHRDCEKCIVHGDIKPANIMLDGSHNAKLGDFGLAKLVEHGGEPKTTQVVAGTLGYIDPKFINNRWPRTESDVYSFGVVLLEIACGKRPAWRQPNGASSLLAWVHDLYNQGMTLDAADQRLNGEFDPQQMERVIVTGLWCAHQDPIWRPSIVEAMDVLRSVGAELPVLAPVHDLPHIRCMEEQAFADLTAEDRPVRAFTQSTYFTSKDTVYLFAEE